MLTIMRDGFPSLIVFVGVVGAGKTTQMEILSSKLKSRQNVKITYLKTVHLFSYVFTKLLSTIILRRTDYDYPLKALRQEANFLFRRMFKLWLIIDVFSLALKFLISVYLPIKLGYTVLVEDYFPASIGEYKLANRRLGFPEENIEWTVRLIIKLSRLLLNDSRVIFLDAYRRELPKYNCTLKTGYVAVQRNIFLPYSRCLAGGPTHRFLYIDTTHQRIKETYLNIIHWLQSRSMNETARELNSTIG